MAVSVSTEDWCKGIALSVTASFIGSASKLAIRKSWLLERSTRDEEEDDDHDVWVSTRESGDDLRLCPSNSSLSHNSNNRDREEITTQAALRYRTVSSFESTSERDNENRLQVETDVEGPLERPRSPRDERIRRQKYLSYTLRGAGMVGMTVLNPLCGVLAMNYASPSILAPFSGLTLVWIILLSGPLIHESPNTRQIFAAMLIVLGEVIVGLYGDHTNDRGITTQQLRKSYAEPPFLAYFAVITSGMLLLGYCIAYTKNPTLQRLAWGVSGGTITGMQNFLKDSLTIFKNHSQLQHLPWIFYMFVALAVSTALLGLLLLTACMKRYDATYSASAFVGSFVVSASIMSSVHYSTFQHLQGVTNYVLYPIGIAILMLGVLVLVLDAPAIEYGHIPMEEDGRDDGSIGTASSPRRVRQ